MDFCQVFCFFTFCSLISLICFGDERTLDEGRGLDSGFYYTFCFFWGGVDERTPDEGAGAWISAPIPEC